MLKDKLHVILHFLVVSHNKNKYIRVIYAQKHLQNNIHCNQQKTKTFIAIARKVQINHSSNKNKYQGLHGYTDAQIKIYRGV